MPYPGTVYGDRPHDFGLKIHKSFDDHFSEVEADFYDPIPVHSTEQLSSGDIKAYFDEARAMVQGLQKI